MRTAAPKLLQERAILLERLAGLSLVIRGSYLERYTTCTRRNCACHKGRKHGPRSYVVVYHNKKQRQVYVPQAKRRLIREGIRQHGQLIALVKEITGINLRLMRTGTLLKSVTPHGKGGKPHA